MHHDFDVAVVGYGPTGLAAASLLGQRGHRVLVCERWGELYGLPRFTHIDAEVARIVQTAADVDVALRDASPVELTFHNAAGDVLIHVPAAPSGPSGYPDHLSVHQPDIEAAIDQRVRELPTVTVRQGWSVHGLEQDGGGVTLHLAPTAPAGAQVPPEGAEQVRVGYVVAADGANSFLRESLGVARDDLGFDERWLNLDAEWRTEAPAHLHDTRQVCDPARGHMSMHIGHRRHRFEFALHPHEDADAMAQEATGWELLRTHYDLGPDDLTIIKRAVYRFEARIAQSWRVGRVLLAGDAAHTMPPYLGQGACSGFRDAANLAWKLDLVLRGLSSAELLDSYEVERRPHTTTLVHGSIALGRVANTSDPDEAARRDAALLSGSVPPPPAPPVLLDGVLARGPDGDPVRAAGRVADQPVVLVDGRRVRLDDVAPGSFLLVSRTDPAPALDHHQRDFLAGMPVEVLVADPADGGLTGLLDGLDTDVVLIRPDHVVFGTARLGDLGDLVQQLQDRLWWQPAPAAVMHRAMGCTRLTDCGMDPADARALLQRTGDGAHWETTAEQLGEAQLVRAAAARSAGHTVTAEEATRAAVGALLFAQMPRNADDTVKRRRYQRYVGALDRLAEVSANPFERIEVEHRSGRLVGWLSLPSGGTADATVVVWGGLSGWGAAYLPYAAALNARGIACLLAEGPGQGESRMTYGIHVDEKAVDGWARFLDVVEGDPRLGSGIGIQGNSYGGVFAAHLASADRRVGACVVNGSVAVPTLPPFRAGREQMQSFVGSRDDADIEHVLHQLVFRPDEHRIPCPLLVLHGGADVMVDEGQARTFAAAGDPATTTLRTWADGEHTIYNHAAERNALTADWFAEHLR